MDFVATALLAATVKKLVDVLRFLIARDFRAVLTQIVAWLSGSIALWLVASSAWGGSLDIGGQKASDLGWASLIVAGIVVGSGGSVLYDTLKSVSYVSMARRYEPVTPPPATETRRGWASRQPVSPPTVRDTGEQSEIRRPEDPQ